MVNILTIKMTVNKAIIDKIYKYINQYIQMDIQGIIINCPYWANKIRNGNVVFKGYLGGKGSADEIRQELIKRLNTGVSSSLQLTPLNLQKFAKRERIGIDCSGFAYRVLDELVRLQYKDTSISDLSEVFKEGVGRASADILTSKDYCFKIGKILDIQLGDLLRMMNGKHIAVVLGIKNSQITYVHSSRLTETQGVHLGLIKIKDKDKSLEYQEWLERTRRGSNFGRKYFYEDKGDGVYRVRIFD